MNFACNEMSKILDSVNLCQPRFIFVSLSPISDMMHFYFFLCPLLCFFFFITGFVLLFHSECNGTPNISYLVLSTYSNFTYISVFQYLIQCIFIRCYFRTVIFVGNNILFEVTFEALDLNFGFDLDPSPFFPNQHRRPLCYRRRRHYLMQNSEEQRDQSYSSQ